MEVYGFGDKIRDLRTRRNMSQETVADHIGSTKATISGYEREVKSPSLEAVMRLALFFNVSTDYLLGLDNREIIRVKDFSLEDQKEFLRIFNAIEDFVHRNDEIIE